MKLIGNLLIFREKGMRECVYNLFKSGEEMFLGCTKSVKKQYRILLFNIKLQ